MRKFFPSHFLAALAGLIIDVRLREEKQVSFPTCRSPIKMGDGKAVGN